MGTIRCSQNLNDTISLLVEAPAKLLVEGRAVVKKNIRRGRTAARANARRNEPVHGKWYVLAITDEMTGNLQGEWGPDTAMAQGNMLFEYGQGRQSTPHLDITHSRDTVAPLFYEDASGLIKRVLW